MTTATTALIGVAAIAAGALVVFREPPTPWPADMPPMSSARQAELTTVMRSEMAASATHAGPLGTTGWRGPNSPLWQLPPPSALSGDGLRFSAEASLSLTSFAVALWRGPGADHADGILITTGPAAHRRRFTLPAGAYGAAMARIGDRMDGWRGDLNACPDGTSYTVERVRGTDVISGAGQNCTEHYPGIAGIVLELLRRHAPGSDLPSNADWRAPL